jgi:hypothetical protein
MDYGGRLDKRLVSDDQSETSEVGRVSHDSGVIMFAVMTDDPIQPCSLGNDDEYSILILILAMAGGSS